MNTTAEARPISPTAQRSNFSKLLRKYSIQIAIVLVALLIWAFVLESLGFLIATFILMTLLYRAAGFKKWYVAVFWGLITVLVTYFVFTYLGVRFPPGILRTLGIG